MKPGNRVEGKTAMIASAQGNGVCKVLRNDSGPKAHRRCEGGKFQGSVRKKANEQHAAQVEVAPPGTNQAVNGEKQAAGLVR